MSLMIENENINLDLLNESLERVQPYYPHEFNIIPATIYLDTKQNKVIKRPKGNWKKYQMEKYPREKLKTCKQVCVVCGKISNSLLVIDFDKNKSSNLSDNQIFKNIIAKHPLLKKSNYIIRTMNGGFHFPFFLNSISVYENLEKQKIDIKAQKTGLKTDIEGIREIDLRCEGNIVLTYPSKYKGKKYILCAKEGNLRPLKITNEQFLDILKAITIKTTPKSEKETKLTIGSHTSKKIDSKFKKLRTPFKDILYGKIEIESYAKKYGKDEHVYWKFLFRELYNKCGLEPKDAYPLLKENQPAFNLETTETQLKYHPYTNKPLTNEKLNEYFPKYKHKEIDGKYGKLHKEIPFDNYIIEIRENGIYRTIFKEKDGKVRRNRELIMYGNLNILYKTTDNKGRNLFSFNFNNVQYNTYSSEDVIKRLTDKIYKGNIGRDIVKHTFNVIGDELKGRKAEYIIGFNNGWKLPQLEIEKKFLLVTYTDYQNKTYNRAKNIIKEYSIKEKEKIKQTLREFVDITQTNKTRLTIIIAWSISAPFRLTFLDYCDIFPHLYNYGERNTGKSSLEKFYIVHFYKIYENYLSSTVLESDSRLEDHASESTFPHNIQECHKVKNINAMPLLKDIATGISLFDRKKSAREIDVEKPKIAGFCLDSNNIVSAFKTPAFNTKSITNEFTKDDVIKIDDKWRKLYRELKKEKLFSFVYEITKDWNNKIIFEKLDSLLNQIKEILKEKQIDFEKIEKENPRIIYFYQIILFGIELFNEAFGIELEKEGVLEALIKGRSILPLELKDQFIHFCKLALKYDHGYDDNYGNWHKGDNPKFLTCPLEIDKNKEYYCFTQDNLRDFNEYAKKNYNLKGLNNLLIDALENKDDMQYVNKRFQGIMTRYIQINKDLF